MSMQGPKSLHSSSMRAAAPITCVNRSGRTYRRQGLVTLGAVWNGKPPRGTKSYFQYERNASSRLEVSISTNLGWIGASYGGTRVRTSDYGIGFGTVDHREKQYFSTYYTYRKQACYARGGSNSWFVHFRAVPTVFRGGAHISNTASMPAARYCVPHSADTSARLNRTRATTWKNGVWLGNWLARTDISSSTGYGERTEIRTEFPRHAGGRVCGSLNYPGAGSLGYYVVRGR